MARVADLDAQPRELVDELLASLNDLHKQGLTSVVRGLRDDPRGKELLFYLIDDPAVHMVLAMHGIIRPDPLILAQRAIAQVRPGINSHGGVEQSGSTAPHVRPPARAGLLDGRRHAARLGREACCAASPA